MTTINIVEGDLTPVIELGIDEVDLTGKTLLFHMRERTSNRLISLEAMLQEAGIVHVPLTAAATSVPGSYMGQIEVVGEQTLFDQVLVFIRKKDA